MTRKPRPRKLPRIHKLEQCDWRGVMRLASRRVLEPGGARYPQKIPCETPETDAR